MASLFYSEDDVFWVYDTFGAERLERDLQQGVFSPEQIIEACAYDGGDKTDLVLLQTLLPYADLQRLPQLVKKLNTPLFAQVREHLLERTPAAAEFVGPPFDNKAVWLLAADYNNPSSDLQKLFASEDPILEVLTNADLLDQTLKTMNNPKAYGAIVWNAVTSLWARPNTLKIALQYAPDDFIQDNIVDLLRAARMTNGSDNPFGAYTAEDMVDELLAVVSEHTVAQWAQQNLQDEDVSRNSDFVQKWGVPHGKGRYDDVIAMMAARSATPPQMFDNSIRYYFRPIGEVSYSEAELRHFARESEIETISSTIKDELFALNPSDARLKMDTYSADKASAAVYVALQNAHPILAKVALDYIDWDNQFAKESLRLSLGPSSSNSKQAIVQKMIVKKEALDLKGRLSAEIAHTVDLRVDRDTDTPGRRM